MRKRPMVTRAGYNMRILSLLLPFLLIPAIAGVNGSAIFAQTRESRLKAIFDHVETFDTLQDWKGGNYGDVSITFTPASDFPKHLDGSASIWEYYSFWGTLPAPAPWIQNHGATNVWGGTGKSLRIDYTESYGPGRLGFHIGSSPSDGYPSEVYVFFMNKYPLGFFPTNGNNILFFSYFKSFEIAAGFRDVWNWGTIAQQQLAYDSVQNRNVYGLNFTVINLHADATYNLPLCPWYNIYAANPDASGDGYASVNSDRLGAAAMSAPVLLGDWFGIEYHFKNSNPPGAANGLFETWVYDRNGNQIGYGLLPYCDIQK